MLCICDQHQQVRHAARWGLTTMCAVCCPMSSRRACQSGAIRNFWNVQRLLLIPEHATRNQAEEDESDPPATHKKWGIFNRTKFEKGKEGRSPQLALEAAREDNKRAEEEQNKFSGSLLAMSLLVTRLDGGWREQPVGAGVASRPNGVGIP